MPLDPTLFLALAQACAPDVAPTTLLAIAHAESGLEPLAIGVNGPAPPRVRATSLGEAVSAADRLRAAGRDIDLGLGQINVRNLARLGLSPADAFDPCRNLAASAQILAEGYRRGVAQAGPGQRALRIALSLYNTGHPERGFANGYVARVTAAAGGERPATPTTSPTRPTPPPSWDSFAWARQAWTGANFVLSPAGATP